MSSDDNEEQIWLQYEYLGSSEKHFNDLQASYRRIASIWMLAVFSGAGLVLTAGETLEVARFVLLGLNFLAGTVGILILWSIDLLVYHRLLDAHFVEGMIMERRYTWLPPIRHNMARSQRSANILRGVLNFYRVPATLFLFASILSVYEWYSERLNLEYNVGGFVLPTWCLALLCAFLSCIILWFYMRIRTLSWRVFRKRLDQFEKRNDS